MWWFLPSQPPIHLLIDETSRETTSNRRSIPNFRVFKPLYLELAGQKGENRKKGTEDDDDRRCVRVVPPEIGARRKNGLEALSSPDLSLECMCECVFFFFVSNEEMEEKGGIYT
jgi:hypothetical protein